MYKALDRHYDETAKRFNALLGSLPVSGDGFQAAAADFVQSLSGMRGAYEDLRRQIGEETASRDVQLGRYGELIEGMEAGYRGMLERRERIAAGQIRRPALGNGGNRNESLFGKFLDHVYDPEYTRKKTIQQMLAKRKKTLFILIAVLALSPHLAASFPVLKLKLLKIAA